MRSFYLLPGVLVVALAASPEPGFATAAPTRAQIAETAARAQELLDAGQADKANALLEPFLRVASPDAQLVLLHSSALILSGDNEGGRKEIERALKLDPKLR